MKQCPTCAVCKPLDAFSPGARAPTQRGISGSCKACKAAYNRKRYKQSEQYRASAKTYYLFWAYGMTPEDLECLKKEQGGQCAICSSPLGLSYHTHIDHNHDTGVVRGLLCNRCNTGLGKFGDEPARLRAAADYLEKRNVDPLWSSTLARRNRRRPSEAEGPHK